MKTFAGTTRAAIGLFMLALLAITLGAFYGFYRGWRQKDAALFTHAEELIVATELQEAFERKSASSRAYLLAGDPLSLDERTHAARDVAVALGKLRARPRSLEDTLLLEDVERALSVHDELQSATLLAHGITPPDAVIRAWSELVMPRARAARASLRAMVEYKRGLHMEAADRARSAGDRAALLMMSIAAGALLVAGLGGALLGRSLRRSYDAEASARARAEAAQGEADDARAFLGALLDELPIGVVAAEPPGTIVHASATAASLLGRDEATATAMVAAPLARALAGELVAEEDLETSAGRILATTAAPIRDGDGHVIAAFVALTDVTDRKRGERERELFLGALGHDLRSPLQAISLSATALLKRVALDEAARRAAARIGASADRMGRLIQQLLDFTRSQHGAIPIHATRTDLVEVAREVAQALEPASAGREIRIDGDARVVGAWDPDRIAQVLQNLIGNAIQYGEPGAPVVVCLRGGAGVRIEVSNRGEPIPDDLRRRIFDPFRRGVRGKGLGLGLYIARAIVAAHGGTLEVESVNRTTTFAVNLPREPRVAAEPDDRPQPASG